MRRVVVVIKQNGEIEVHSEGMKGKMCAAYIDAFCQALDAIPLSTPDDPQPRFTREYYEETEDESAFGSSMIQSIDEGSVHS